MSKTFLRLYTDVSAQTARLNSDHNLAMLHQLGNTETSSTAGNLFSSRLNTSTFKVFTCWFLFKLSENDFLQFSTAFLDIIVLTICPRI